MLHIVRILAVIFGVLALLIGIIAAAVLSAANSACVNSGGVGCPNFGGFAALILVLFFIGALINFVIFVAAGSIRDTIDSGAYEQAKSSLVVWTIIGFLLGGIIIGIFLLVAYLKIEPVVDAQRNPPPTVLYVAMPGTAPPPPPPPGTPFCSRCGAPTTFVPQYGRYYCYRDRLYVDPTGPAPT